MAMIEKTEDKDNEKIGKDEKVKRFKKNNDDHLRSLAIDILKSGFPSIKCAAINALMVISPLVRISNPDSESLAVCGFIYRRLWLLDKSEIELLGAATNYYRRAYKEHGCFWSGYEYLLCIDLKRDYLFGDYDDPEDFSEAGQAERDRLLNDSCALCSEIYDKIKEMESSEDFVKRHDIKELYGIMAVICSRSHLSFDHKKYEKLFFDQKPTKNEIKRYLERRILYI
jgi:hypothetical protein